MPALVKNTVVNKIGHMSKELEIEILNSIQVSYFCVGTPWGLRIKSITPMPFSSQDRQ